MELCTSFPFKQPCVTYLMKSCFDHNIIVETKLLLIIHTTECVNVTCQLEVEDYLEPPISEGISHISYLLRHSMHIHAVKAVTNKIIQLGFTSKMNV